MKKTVIAVFLLACFFLFPEFVFAGNNNSYVTVVIPLRSRDYWQDLRNVTPIFEFLKSADIPVTVLVQYSNLNDSEVISYLKGLGPKFEIGIFLEVDDKLATAANASYIYGIGDRANANIILLSGYEIGERKRIIAENFRKFRSVFDSQPKSAGAWYIDTVSQNYLKNNYGIETLLDVADQWNTDTYGLWGKPWSVAYIPSSVNGMVPFNNVFDNSKMVKIQWAARDPLNGYGLSVLNSTYSVQANDYAGHNLDLNYFKYLSSVYLENIKNPLNQLTVGLEAGQEGSAYLDEFKREITSLSLFNFVTMRQFADIYKDYGETFPRILENSASNRELSSAWWFIFKNYRALLVLDKNNLYLTDLRNYSNFYLDKDVLGKDKSKNLERVVPACLDNARFNNRVRLAGKVTGVDVIKQENSLTLNIKTDVDKRTLIFSENGIYTDKGAVFNAALENGLTVLLKSIFYELVFKFQSGKRQAQVPELSFSKLNGRIYFGISSYPGNFIGFSQAYPFFGDYKIPFQILSKFKRPDFESLFLIYLDSFVNRPVNCKISI